MLSFICVHREISYSVRCYHSSEKFFIFFFLSFSFTFFWCSSFVAFHFIWSLCKSMVFLIMQCCYGHGIFGEQQFKNTVFQRPNSEASLIEIPGCILHHHHIVYIKSIVPWSCSCRWFFLFFVYSLSLPLLLQFHLSFGVVFSLSHFFLLVSVISRRMCDDAFTFISFCSLLSSTYFFHFTYYPRE